MKLAARTTLLVFSLTLLFGLGHYIGVIANALQSSAFVYDFRFYSMLLVGAGMIAPSVVALRQVSGLRRGELAAWRRVLAASVVLLAIHLPMLPMQRAAIFVAFGALVSGLALTSLLSLSAARREFGG